MNDNGQHNGQIRWWVDGKLVMEKMDLMLRLPGQTYGVDSIVLAHFFGGSSASWQPLNDVFTEFRDISVSTDPPFCAGGDEALP